MTNIESTPEAAETLYRTMAERLEIVRARVRRPLSLSEKVLFGHLDDPQGQELAPGKAELLLRPDRVVFQDVLGQSGLLQFMQTGRERVAVPTTIHCDHLIQARVEGKADLRASLAENGEIYAFLRSAAARYGAGFWEPGAGIIHQVVLENYAFPGALILGTDSHTPNAGGLGACAIGVGGADAVETIAGMPWGLLHPRRIAVFLTGKLSGWTAPKDVILWVAGQLSVSGGTNAIVEYIGPGARTISATGKATITNMGAELGATTSMFPADARMARYLEATGREGLARAFERQIALLAPDPEVEVTPEHHYDQVLRLDLSALEPHVVGPHTPDRARPISKLAAEVATHGFPARISAALIGSCTNSSYEDMSRAADVAGQAASHGLRAPLPFLVTPGSEQIRATIERDGQLARFEGIGATVLANACGPCIGQWRRSEDASREPNAIVTSYNRNFPRRNDGSAATMNFIASPELVTAFALAGSLSFNPLSDALRGADGAEFRLTPPRPAPEVPERGFDRGRSAFVAPPANGAAVEIQIDPHSERLQRLAPWPAWDGRDFLDLAVLLKTQGKTTTDHISPAGPWLRFRGHLDKFSDNFLMGARDAFTGQTAERVAPRARDYQAHGVRWVVVGDHNYGEGSSREHAALSPRLLGGVAVIARSFARIHETNLKKQGLLALTFSSPDDYDKILPGDRLDLVGLAALAPGKPVECTVHHADGTRESLWLEHSYGARQLEWFRKGSAVNALR
jgi:aconitate hydratase A / 2-methylisocitrate dehydratase